MSRAIDLYLAQESAGKSIEQISQEVGYSRTAVSLWKDGKYEANPRNIESAILKAYDRHDCPHTGEEITPDVCRKKALGPRPFGGAERRAWWLCCQTCPNCPKKPKPITESSK
ncbi:hypothetical protein [Propionivibrio sp.]|uniref:hypothetical protein n=1 Tax=Propionivibrio sp. TaxID=2212460 RepID=UPI003BF14A6D